MTTKTADEFNAEAAAHDAEATASFERCDTDGFLSQWASGINAEKARANAKIAAAGGTALFGRDKLVTLAGEETGARRVTTRYGDKWRIDATDEWIGAKTDAGLAKRGYRVERETQRATATAIIAGSGRGLAGATSCYVAVIRTDGERGWFALLEG